ncbi:primosomal protein N', partial [Escherichia coli]|nr:primosomal protein N' [Escherichia coli]
EDVMIPARPVVAPPDPDYAPAELSGDQADAARQLVDAVTAHGFSVSLLDGVTGSGKTEVYFEAVAKAIEQGKQVLI